jgi:DNA-binding response OmpR family regulator
MNRTQTESRKGQTSSKRPTTILVGEDDADDALLLERAFQDAGIQSGVHFVRDSTQLIHFLQGAGEYADRDRFPLPTLLLLDLKLGHTNGLEVLQWLQAHPEVRQHLIVVVLTGSEAKDLVHMAYHLGANSYLVKPMDYHELVAMVRALSEFWFQYNVMPGA